MLKHTFSDIFLLFSSEKKKKDAKMKINLKTAKQVFQPALGCTHPKADWNTQQTGKDNIANVFSIRIKFKFKKLSYYRFYLHPPVHPQSPTSHFFIFKFTISFIAIVSKIYIFPFQIITFYSYNNLTVSTVSKVFVNFKFYHLFYLKLWEAQNIQLK